MAWVTDDAVETPAFVVDEGEVLESVGRARRLTLESGCELLYALKALSAGDVLRILRDHVAGFSASSLFEAELARDVLGPGGSVHITTPGFRPDEMSRLNDVCDYVALNSLSQLQRFGPALDRASVGLRVNPGLSFREGRPFRPLSAAIQVGSSPSWSVPCPRDLSRGRRRGRRHPLPLQL